MDLFFSKEEQLIQKAAREFGEQVIAPVADQIDRENKIPKEVMEGLAELGMFGIQFPEEFGGSGAGHLCYMLALEQLSKAAPGVGATISVNSVPLAVIQAFGSDEQKKKYMRDGVTGKKIYSFAFTEPGTGSDPKQLTTMAVKDGDHYVINGTKRFITNAGFEGTMVVIAKEEESGKATAFILDKFCEGYSVSKPWDKIAAHGGELYDVYFNNVRVHRENMLGSVGDGLWVLKIAMVYGKLGLVALFLGVAAAAYEEGVRYAKEKTHRGVSIAEKFEHVKIAVAEMTMKMQASRLYAYHLGHAADHLKDPMELVKEAALAKVYVAETGIEVCKLAMGIHGSYGLQREYRISRLWSDVIFGPQVEGTAPLLKILAAGVILGK
jgi:alkylation response protein AidB-like acyl-CoA dehydrogenase